MKELLEVLRSEYKYGINGLEAAQLEYMLRQALRPDAHNGPGGYLVRSLYFDTPNDSDFYDKLDGYEMRRKIRLRVYNSNAATAKLEMKEKQGSCQRKRSLTLPREDAQRLCAGDYTPLLKDGSPFALELYSRMRQYYYLPKCIVEYDRKAFLADANDTRITLDSGLRASESCLDPFAARPALYPVGEPGAVTLEVKYSRFLLSYVKDLVSLSKRTAISQSKYCAARNVTMRKDP